MKGERDMLQEPLQCFLLVAKYKSFAKAAKELYLSTPAITQRINALEDSLGFKLFIRSNKGALLTSAGEAFLKEAEKLIIAFNQAVACCRAISEKEKSHLSVGVSGTVNKVLLPKICKTFYEHNKNVNLSFINTTDLTSELLQGMIDINITYGNMGVSFPQICNTTLIVDEAVCVVPVNHKYANRKYIRIQDLYNENIIMSPLKTSAYHRNIYSLLKKNNPSANVIFSDNYHVAVLQTLSSDAISIFPKSYQLGDENFVLIPFESFPYISIDALTKDAPKGMMNNFIDEAKSMLKV